MVSSSMSGIGLRLRQRPACPRCQLSAVSPASCITTTEAASCMPVLLTYEDNGEQGEHVQAGSVLFFHSSRLVQFAKRSGRTFDELGGLLPAIDLSKQRDAVADQAIGDGIGVHAVLQQLARQLLDK